MNVLFLTPWHASQKACGHWVADMHMLWNELHPITSLSIVPEITYTGAKSADFNDPAQSKRSSPATAVRSERATDIHAWFRTHMFRHNGFLREPQRVP